PPLSDLRTCIQGEGISVWAHTRDCLRKLDVLRAELPEQFAPWRSRIAAAWDAPVSKLASAGALTRIAMLLHDIAKPTTRAEGEKLALTQHLRCGAELLAYHFEAGAVASPPVLLDGEAIMRALNLPPGKLVGELKEALLEATAGGEVKDKAGAKAFVRAE